MVLGLVRNLHAGRADVASLGELKTGLDGCSGLSSCSVIWRVEHGFTFSKY